MTGVRLAILMFKIRIALLSLMHHHSNSDSVLYLTVNSRPTSSSYTDDSFAKKHLD